MIYGMDFRNGAQSATLASRLKVAFENLAINHIKPDNETFLAIAEDCGPVCCEPVGIKLPEERTYYILKNNLWNSFRNRAAPIDRDLAGHLANHIMEQGPIIVDPQVVAIIKSEARKSFEERVTERLKAACIIS